MTAATAALDANDVIAVIGTVISPSGLTHAKTVPFSRVNAFADPGLGASPVWHGFTIDQTGIAFTDDIGVVGDERIRIDLPALAILGGGMAWAPGSFYDQAGNPIAMCSRGTLARIEARLAEHGLAARIGHEIEFVLVGPDGAALPSNLWAQYGLAGLLEHEDFARDVMAAATAAGVGIEQFHPEYGLNQFEISLRPRTPVAAADHLVLMRIIIGRVARQHGLRVSLSPVPFAGAVGSGAHQHFSLTRDGSPVFSGGSGPHGMTPQGASAIAGVLAGLPAAQGVLSGSILSGLRMQPGHWAGAYVCWGSENREAAVRFLAGGSGNPHGANVEVKIVDPSANPYLATAAILGLALDGIERNAPLPSETTVDPATQTVQQRAEAATVQLPDQQTDILAALDDSDLIRSILGDPVVDMLVTVRRHEQDNYGDLTPDELAAKFRLAWSV
ncbi:glutamine synthetase family protein [Mycolicibacterium komossense]|uniref:Glutamine synthetase n=1 Tax=Mycolicibacterium komossense TaxID=1779 RepID=A0ABT3CA09_9MYCO|nr:glutamine synthetase family protein [Mycolicibacterium komossense]MCV7226317.1 glutamine synthetase [Mycolicibacterium komossense]